jgi:PAS domain-containing protein
MNNNIKSPHKKRNFLKDELYRLIKTDDSIIDFIQESTLDGLWYQDLEKTGNDWMNPRFWKVLGYNPDEIPQKKSAWQSIINADDLLNIVKIQSILMIRWCGILIKMALLYGSAAGVWP